MVYILKIIINIMKKDYLFEGCNNDQQSEKLIKKFIFNNANKVCFSEFHDYKLGFFYCKKIGGMRDGKFLETLDKLNKDRIDLNIQKIQNDKKIYGHTKIGWKKNQYHSYKLSDEIKNIFFDEYMCDILYKHLYGLIDPMFYKNDELVASVINHERYIFLYSLDEKQLKYFSDNNIKLGEIRK